MKAVDGDFPAMVAQKVVKKSGRGPRCPLVREYQGKNAIPPRTRQAEESKVLPGVGKSGNGDADTRLENICGPLPPAAREFLVANIRRVADADFRVCDFIGEGALVDDPGLRWENRASRSCAVNLVADIAGIAPAARETSIACSKVNDFANRNAACVDLSPNR